MTHAQIAANARKPYADRMQHIQQALDRATQHNAADENYREGWHAALSIIRQAMIESMPSK